MSVLSTQLGPSADDVYQFYSKNTWRRFSFMIRDRVLSLPPYYNTAEIRTYYP